MSEVLTCVSAPFSVVGKGFEHRARIQEFKASNLGVDIDVFDLWLLILLFSLSS